MRALQKENDDLRMRLGQLEIKLNQIVVLERQNEMLGEKLKEADARFREIVIERDSYMVTITQREEEMRSASLGFANREAEYTNIIRELNEKYESLRAQYDQDQIMKSRLMSETQQLNVRISQMQMEIQSFRELEIRFKSMITEKEQLERTIIEITQEMESWKQSYTQLKMDFDRFMIDDDTMKEKYDRLQIICDDHVKEIEKKAIFISKMQQRMVSTCSELDRVSKGDILINTNKCLYGP